MLRLEHISYTIQEKYILRDISCAMHAGETVALLGPNGAGKSTLLRAISKDIQPSSGQIHFFGKELMHYHTLELARMRAVLTQQSQVSMNFSVEEILMMGRYPHFNGRPTTHDHQAVHQAMQHASLEHLKKRIYPSLSGGEKQRVNLSRTLAQVWEGMQNPSLDRPDLSRLGTAVPGKLLLLDEPLNNLDIEHQHQSLEMAREFASRGNTVITVLHDLNMAARFADKLLLLSEGKLFAAGTPEEVLNAENISHVFHYPAEVHKHPFLDCPMVYYGSCHRKTSSKPNTHTSTLHH